MGSIARRTFTPIGRFIILSFQEQNFILFFRILYLFSKDCVTSSRSAPSCMAWHSDETCWARVIISFGSSDAKLGWRQPRSAGGATFFSTTNVEGRFAFVYDINSKCYGHKIEHRSYNLDADHGRSILVFDVRPLHGVTPTVNATSVGAVAKLFSEWTPPASASSS
mgnify:CR=1 FL=1